VRRQSNALAIATPYVSSPLPFSRSVLASIHR
jgi:hypothetical protein